MVLLDTCAIIDLCLSQPTLSPKALRKIQKEGAHILSISFAEIALKQRMKKLQLNRSAREIWIQYSGIANMDIIDIDTPLWLASIDLNWKNRDPVDRLLVAYAQENKMDLITTDKLIKKYYKKVVW